MNPSGNERVIVRWTLAQLLVLVAASGVFMLPLAGHSIALLVIAVVILSFCWPRCLKLIPHSFGSLAPYALLLILAADFFLSRGDFLPSLYRMLLWLLLYRVLQIRNGREDLQVLLLALFLILATGVLSMELYFALQLMLFSPLALALLFVHNLSRSSYSPVSAAGAQLDLRPDFGAVAWGRIRILFWRRLDRRTLLVAVGLYLVLTLLTGLLFVLLPRFEIGQALPFPRLQAARSWVGFSDQIQFGDVVEIIDDGRIALRVDVQMDAPPALPYWRMVVLDAYAEDGFRVSAEVLRRQRSLRSAAFFKGNAADPLVSVPESQRWTLYLEGGVSRYLPIGGHFSRMLFNHRQDLEVFDLSGALRLREIPASTFAFRMEGLEFTEFQPAVMEDLALRGEGPIAVDTRSSDYLADLMYPRTTLAIPADAASVAIVEESLRLIGPRGSDGAAEYARRIVDFLRDGRGYSLAVQIPDGSAELPLRWLQSGQSGHCELYAGAFVLLARGSGIPARMVTGFVGGDWNGFENFFMVRNRHAHAWSEIYLEGRGWLRVDPTPGYGFGDATTVPLGALAASADRTFQAWLDSLRMLWMRRVILFDRTDQQQLVTRLRGGLEWTGDGLLRFLRRVKAGLSPSAEQDGVEQPAVLPGQLGWILICSMVVVAVMLIRTRRQRRLSREAHLRRAAARVLRRSGLPPAQLSATDAELWEQLQRIRYGPMSAWPADPKRVIQSARNWSPSCSR